MGIAAGAALYAAGGTVLRLWFPLTGDLAQEMAGALPWMAAMLPLGMLIGVAIGALESCERFLLSNLSNLLGVFFGQVAPLVAVMLFGPSLRVIMPTLMLGRLVVVVGTLAVALWLERPIRSLRPDPASARSLFRYGAWVSVSGLVSPILDTFDQMVIGRMLGAAAVAHYAVPMSLSARSQVLAVAVARTLFPRLSRETSETSRDLTGRAALALAFVFGAICGPAIIVIGPFLQLWVGAEFARHSTLVAQILLFGAWMNGVAFLPLNQLLAQGRPNLIARLHLLEVGPFLMILWLLIREAGLPGAALAWTLRTGVDCLALLWIAGSLRDVAARAAPAVALMAVALAIAVGAQPAPVAALILAGLLGAAFLGFGMAVEPKLGEFVQSIADRTLPPSAKRLAARWR